MLDTIINDEYFAWNKALDSKIEKFLISIDESIINGNSTEVSGGGYARQTVAFTTSGNTTSNNAAVEYPTATGNYGTVTHVGVYDASSSGNLMAYAALSSNKTIETGDVFRVPSGDLDITLN